MVVATEEAKPAAPRKQRAHRDPTRIDEPDVMLTPGTFLGSAKAFFSTYGDIARFSLDAIRQVPSAVRLYNTEVLRQTALLVLSSGLIIWAMELFVGIMCGTEASYTLKQVGAPLYSGIFAAFCAVREMAPYMWGYILAAKVGCGLVAEIGSMRISEEIDAMEVLGIRPMSYIVATRVTAAAIAMPFLYIVGLGIMGWGEWFVVVKQLGEVSNGGFLWIFWGFQNPFDLFGSLTKIMVSGLAIVFVGCYYGYYASGGSVGVGKNTAKSMMLNMVLVHIVGMLGTQLFWGAQPNAPIAN